MQNTCARLALRAPLSERSGTQSRRAEERAGNSRRHARSSTWSREHAICSLHFLSPHVHTRARVCTWFARPQDETLPPFCRNGERVHGRKIGRLDEGERCRQADGWTGNWRKNRHWYERGERYDTRQEPRKTERIGVVGALEVDACARGWSPSTRAIATIHRYHHHRYHHHRYHPTKLSLRRGKQPWEQAAKSFGAR